MESSLIDVNSVKRMSPRFTAYMLAGIATSLLATTMLAAQAEPAPQESAQQEEAAAGPSSALDIPDSVTLFGKRDPNVRTATALINGEVITQTDVDQRLALVVLANGGKVSD